jgi:hypothetical protein
MRYSLERVFVFSWKRIAYELSTVADLWPHEDGAKTLIW